MEDAEEREGSKEEQILSEVFVSEVLADLSVAGEREVVVGGGVSGLGGGGWSTSGSSPWKVLQSVCALSSNTLTRRTNHKSTDFNRTEY